jgi:hypothetical protein
MFPSSRCLNRGLQNKVEAENRHLAPMDLVDLIFEREPLPIFRR